MTHDVIIIGGGPAGLTAARTLLRGGVRDVVVIERNPECGGLPRFCQHPGWGMLDFHRVWRGPRYARALVHAARGATFLTDCAVTAIEPGGIVQVNTPHGAQTMRARAILLATGIRETPRAPRLIGGMRPFGVLNTGAFQELARFGRLPFRTPVVIGSELVAFSALATARHAGARPVALLEEHAHLSVPSVVGHAASWRYRVPVRTATRLVEILGRDRVEGVMVEHRGRQALLPCDSVVLTGCFRPEATLADGNAVRRDLDGTRGPIIDNFYRCDDPQVFAAGNVLRGVEHSGYVAREGRDAARAILRALSGDLPAPTPYVSVRTTGLGYVYPQRLTGVGQTARLFARDSSVARGDLVARDASRRVIARRSGHTLLWPRLDITLTVPDPLDASHVSLERETAEP
ncbi:putative NAD/FAD-dependent oxidoreductase [Ameyamaea chiangmaiensis NBRC 103196]|uniref:FAD-dependent oxidoreductase n=1 Tax=Ameyamaea chiangmaiensis TaxID=442969 RepID=A0A850P5K7_9PROT|nr:FAD-dependent oxidoreductase [Ameyamaea chiangmaiensis]MBS4073927.1 FAD-dependent oxidoreductase [Ameyamaea chiangmaiensis]NVN39925.1 FAD-dependent oxidoreductase [Ameyamaea chiangmaiensis]GBQ67904.1 putative NAD/FAD-dependent oxidoreductase [Ameyamaea chiangmaiensis NBRC 103196]